jgi:hypothetical protein
VLFVAKGTLKGFLEALELLACFFPDGCNSAHNKKIPIHFCNHREKRIQKVLKDSKGNFFKSFLWA